MKESFENFSDQTHQDSHRGDLFKPKVLSEIVASDSVKTAQERPKKLTYLVETTKEAREALMESLTGVGDAIELFEPMSRKYLESLRGFRMTAIAEVATVKKPLEDIRKFFIGPEHEKEIAALKEFVDLCERLERLKKSGFLDAVADTILKLA